jgi:hypothetical protein
MSTTTKNVLVILLLVVLATPFGMHVLHALMEFIVRNMARQ